VPEHEIDQSGERTAAVQSHSPSPCVIVFLDPDFFDALLGHYIARCEEHLVLDTYQLLASRFLQTDPARGMRTAVVMLCVSSGRCLRLAWYLSNSQVSHYLLYEPNTRIQEVIWGAFTLVASWLYREVFTGSRANLGE